MGVVTAPADRPAPYDGPPLVVAYRGNFSRSWCTEVHVAASLESLGHTVVRLQEDTTTWADTLAAVGVHGAQVVLWTKTWPTEMADALPFLERLEEHGVPTVAFHLDRFAGLDREHQIDDHPFFRCALVVSPDDSPKWAEHGVNHLWLPPGVYDAECGHVPPDRRRFPHDVIFVGSHPYPHPEWEPYRSELIRRMQAEFGRRFAVWPRRGQPIRGKNLQTLYASARVVVGDSCLAGDPSMYWSDRIPETLGRGGLLVHLHVSGMTDWYEPGVDMLTYHQGDFDGAVMEVGWALDLPTEAAEIAEHGRETVLGRDTYRHRMATVLGHVAETLGIGPSVPASRPAPPPAPAAAPAGQRPLRVTHRPTGARAHFYVVPGAETDAIAVQECWVDDQYELVRGEVRGKTVVDIGANVGAFSILAAAAGARRVVAYEPHPATFAVLQRNVADNAAGIVVEPRRLAVWDTAARLAMTGTGGGAFPVALGDYEQDPDAVPAVTLASIVDELGPVGFCKIDTEGSEYRIIDGEALPGIERLAMEFHGPGMPHLDYLADGHQQDRWGRMVATLAAYGRVRIFGRPMVGGLLWWERF